jgi:hypothetical protein
VSVELVGGELARRKVSEVLVDPVGGKGARDPRLPPVRGPHLLDPRLGDVPVVVDVVVVEEHRARDGREEPADRGVAPRFVVEPRVLLEVRNLLAGRLPRVAPRPDPLERQRRDLVGVYLVAEEDDGVRPLVHRPVLHPARVSPEGVDLEAVGVVVGRERVRRDVGR